MSPLIQQSQQAYYEGTDLGNYQFTSLNRVINQFIVAYVGEDKIISKVKRTDVAFHAQRALQELSFDVFKSCKAQEVVLPGSLQMILPQDYVNYVKLTWSDSSGIEHRIYPIKDTSNPLKILQDNDGNYTFPSFVELVQNRFFTDGVGQYWFTSYGSVPTNISGNNNYPIDTYTASAGSGFLFTSNANTTYGVIDGRAHAVWQQIDVSQANYITLSAKGLSAAEVGSSGVGHSGAGTLRIGIQSNPLPAGVIYTSTASVQAATTNLNAPDIAYLEWSAGNSDTTPGTATTLTLEDINVSSHNTVWVLITSYVPFTGNFNNTSTFNNNAVEQRIRNVSVLNQDTSNTLQTSEDGFSDTWSNYKSTTPSENNNDDYEDDTYWPANGERYGLDPLYANANGSFYIDCNAGKIHFSSNLVGKTVILHYLSDSLGTADEMKVHKFAEEAMYKWIAHAIMSTRANTPEYQVMRFKKERFAEIRKAKLRLSNIKLEEITQVFRGKSKQIKH